MWNWSAIYGRLLSGLSLNWVLCKHHKTFVLVQIQSEEVIIMSKYSNGKTKQHMWVRKEL